MRKTVKLNSFISNKGSRQVIGPCQHRVHMRSSFTSMSAAVRSLERAAPLSRSQRSLVRARRTVLATFGKLLRFFQKSLDLSLDAFKKKNKNKKNSLKGSEKSLNLATKSLSWQPCARSWPYLSSSRHPI